jgi:hypothetical protein
MSQSDKRNTWRAPKGQWQAMLNFIELGSTLLVNLVDIKIYTFVIELYFFLISLLQFMLKWFNVLRFILICIFLRIWCVIEYFNINKNKDKKI